MPAENNPVPTGWRCPGCAVIYAPTVQSCPECGQPPQADKSVLDGVPAVETPWANRQMVRKEDGMEHHTK